MRFNRFLQLMTFPWMAKEGSRTSGLDTYGIADTSVSSQAKGTPHFRRYLPLYPVFLVALIALLLLVQAKPTEAQQPAETPQPLTLSVGAESYSETAGTVTVTATLDTPAPSGGVEVTLSSVFPKEQEDQYHRAYVLTYGIGLAKETEDYTLPPAFTIVEGQKSASAYVSIVDDGTPETPATEWIILAAKTSPDSGQNSIAITVHDNDFWETSLSTRSMPYHYFGEPAAGCYGGDPPCTTLMDTRQFVLGSQTYRFAFVAFLRNEIKIGISPPVPPAFAGMSFSVDGNKFPIFDAEMEEKDNVSYLNWKNHGLDSNYAFGPKSVKLALDATPPGPPDKLRFLAATDTPRPLPESYGALPVKVLLNRPAGEEGVSVTPGASAGASATPGEDFTVSPPTINIPKGEWSATFTVNITDDSKAEGVETIDLTASTNPAGISVKTLPLSIASSDGPPPVEFWTTTLTTRQWTIETPPVPGGPSFPPQPSFPGCDDEHDESFAHCSKNLTRNTFQYDGAARSIEYLHDDRRAYAIIFKGTTLPESFRKYLTVRINGNNYPIGQQEYSGGSAVRIPHSNTPWTVGQNVPISLLNSRTFTISDASALEGNNAELTIELGEDAPPEGLTLKVTTNFDAPSSASANDLDNPPATVSVPAGRRTAVLSIPIAKDSVNEGEETFTVTLTPAGAASWHGHGAATVTIQNYDIPAVSFNGNTVPNQTYTAGVQVNRVTTLPSVKMMKERGRTLPEDTLVLPEATGDPASTLAYTITGLPSGLRMNHFRGIEGTPVAPTGGPVTVTYTGTDERSGDSASLTFEVTVNGPVAPFTYEDGLPLTGDIIEYTIGQNEALTVTLPQTTGGTGRLSYHLYDSATRQPLNNVAQGINFNPDTRVLQIGGPAGEPASAQSYVITYWAIDQNGAAVTLDSSLHVAETVSLPPVQDPLVGYTGETISVTLPEATGGSRRLVGIKYTLEPDIEGFRFNPATRTLSGSTTTVLLSRELTYTATDRNGVIDYRTFAFAVHPSAGAPKAPPPPPTARVQEGYLFLTWNNVPDATGYIIQLRDSAQTCTDDVIQCLPEGATLLGLITQTTESVAVLTGLDTGTYMARVAASNGQGTSLWSEEVTVVIGKP